MESGHMEVNEDRALLDLDLSAFCAVSAAGNVIGCNAAFASMFGFRSKDDACGSRLADLFRHADEYSEFLARLARSKTLRAHQATLLKKDGTMVRVIANAAGTYNTAGDFTGIHAFLLNAPAVAGDRLRGPQKAESVGVVAGGIAHDFNNLLSIIHGHVALLPRDITPNEKVERRINAITLAVDRGARLVRQLMTFARSTDMTMESVDVNTEIKEFVGMLSDTLPAQITLTVDLEPDLPRFSADRQKLQQALLNLFINARDAIIEGPRNGTITLRTLMVPDGEVRRWFPAAQASRYVCIAVSDTGKGMDRATQQRAFEPFFTTKQEARGTGLGLSVVERVTRTLQGYVRVESDLGKGATFFLYIPAVVRPRTGAATSTDQCAPGRLAGNETILVVEDEEMLCELVSSTLRTHGYTVLAARDGQEAMDIFAANAPGIDVVFTDIGLPKMSGLEIFLKMKSLKPGVRVIFTSGYLEPDTHASLMHVGARMVLEKPLHGDQIARAIRQIMDSGVNGNRRTPAEFTVLQA